MLSVASFAADTLVKELNTNTVKGKDNGYATAEDVVADGITWNATGNLTMQPWRIGGKNLTKEDRNVFTKTAITDDISKIEVSHGSSTVTMNSFKLLVASNADFSDAVEYPGEFKARETTTFTRPADANWANKYYKFVYNVTVGSSNKYFQLVGVKFYKEIADIVATGITLDQTSLDMEVGGIATLVASLEPEGATTAVVWTSSDENVATVDNGKVTAVAAGDATITATAGEGVSATCAVKVAAAAPKTLAELDYAVDGTQYALAPVTVVYVNGASIYIQDATGAGLIYGSSLTLNAGDVVAGLVVKTKVFNKLPELETTLTNADVTITAGAAPAPVEAAAAPVAADVNKYLSLKGVVFASDAATLSGNYPQNVTASFNGADLVIRDNFKITDGTIKAGTYTIEGFVCLYKTTVQFYPTKIVSTPTGVENATVAEKAVKMIENGQLVIVREGVKYNAQGAVVE